jgi:hypothetical protein
VEVSAGKTVSTRAALRPKSHPIQTAAGGEDGGLSGGCGLRPAGQAGSIWRDLWRDLWRGLRLRRRTASGVPQVTAPAGAGVIFWWRAGAEPPCQQQSSPLPQGGHAVETQSAPCDGNSPRQGALGVTGQMQGSMCRERRCCGWPVKVGWNGGVLPELAVSKVSVPSAHPRTRGDSGDRSSARGWCCRSPLSLRRLWRSRHCL